MLQPGRGGAAGRGSALESRPGPPSLSFAVAVTLFVDPIEGMLFAACPLGLAALSAWSPMHPRG